MSSSKGPNKLYQDLAELVQANVSGPMRRKMVEKAQRRLVDKLMNQGLISDADADYLRA